MKIIRRKSVKQSPLIMVSFIICIISMGCTKTEMTKQEQNSTEQLTAVTTTEALTTEKKSYTETTMEEPMVILKSGHLIIGILTTLTNIWFCGVLIWKEVRI